MKKKYLILTVAVLVVGSIFLVGKEFITDIRNKSEKSEQIEESINENSNSDNEDVYDLDKELDKVDEENKLNKEDIIIENGFKSSILSGNSDKEIQENNKLIPESKFSLNERIKAKNVAENFVQAIESFDIEKPKETVELAVKNVADELKNEVESLYMYLGKNQDIKKKVIESVKSVEQENEYDNDYIIFDVYVDWSVIDQYDQISNTGKSSYRVQLLKINGKYKVVSYRVI